MNFHLKLLLSIPDGIIYLKSKSNITKELIGKIISGAYINRESTLLQIRRSNSAT
jgi:hypothetical protein